MRRVVHLFVLGIIAALACEGSPIRAQDKAISRIGFGSCMSQENPQPIWDAVLAQKPELFILLGDNIYGDTDNPEVLKRKYEQLGAQLGFAKLRSSCQLFATWDDHDYGSDDIGAENPIKDASQKIFLDFFKEPEDSPRRKRQGVYGSMTIGPSGKRVQVILLDTRYHRSKLKKEGKDYVADPNPTNTFLGEEQWKWLADQLKRPAELRLIGSSIQVVAEDHPFEKWANFPAEREKLYNLLRESKAGGVIILSGDRHLAELSTMDAGLGFPLLDLTSSGLNMGAKRWRSPEVNRHRVATMTHGDNFGMIHIDWERNDPTVRLQIRDVEGEVTIQDRFDLSLLKPAAKAPEKAVAANPTPTPAPTSGAITPAEAAKHVGEQVTVEFAVNGTGATRDRARYFLNSSEQRDKDNFTIVLDAKKLGDALKEAGIEDPRTHYKGKTVRVTGKVSIFNNAPQIVVEELKQIVVMEK